MDIFDIHDKVVQSYARHVDSFLTVEDEAIREFVRREVFEQRSLWPDALLQLNPAYERAATIDDLVGEGLLHPDCGAIFGTADGRPLHLYRHQVEAIRRAAAGQARLLGTSVERGHPRDQSARRGYCRRDRRGRGDRG